MGTGTGTQGAWPRFFGPLSGLIVVIFCFVAAASAAAAPAVDGEFAVSGTPGQLAHGPDGNVWVQIQGATNELARIAPDGSVTEFDVDDLTGAIGITSGPDGNLWFTKPNAVVKVDPATPTAASVFAVGDISDPRRITAGPDGNLWTASGDKVIRIPPADPTTFTSFTVAGMGARGIAAGGDGQLWVADFAGARVVSISTDGATITPYDVGAGTGPQEVAAGPNSQIAYTNQGAIPHEIGRIAPGGTPQRLPVPGTDPFGITLGADGAYWIAQFTSNALGRLTPDGKYTTLPGLSAGAGARWIVAGSDNTLWVSLETALKVARVSGVEAEVEPPDDGGDDGGGGPDQEAMPTKPRALKVAKRIRREARVAPRRVAKGGQIRFRLAEPGRFRISFERVRVGRKVGKRCVKASGPARGATRRGRAVRGERRGKRCRRFVRVKPTIVLRGVEGLNRVRFRGRVRKRFVLKPGRYRLSVVALSADGRTSAPARAGFRLVAPRR